MIWIAALIIPWCLFMCSYPTPQEEKDEIPQFDPLDYNGDVIFLRSSYKVCIAAFDTASEKLIYSYAFPNFILNGMVTIGENIYCILKGKSTHVVEIHTPSGHVTEIETGLDYISRIFKYDNTLLICKAGPNLDDLNTYARVYDPVQKKIAGSLYFDGELNTALYYIHADDGRRYFCTYQYNRENSLESRGIFARDDNLDKILPDFSIEYENFNIKLLNSNYVQVMSVSVDGVQIDGGAFDLYKINSIKPFEAELVFQNSNNVIHGVHEAGGYLYVFERIYQSANGRFYKYNETGASVENLFIIEDPSDYGGVFHNGCFWVLNCPFGVSEYSGVYKINIDTMTRSLVTTQ